MYNFIFTFIIADEIDFLYKLLNKTILEPLWECLKAQQHYIDTYSEEEEGDTLSSTAKFFVSLDIFILHYRYPLPQSIMNFFCFHFSPTLNVSSSSFQSLSWETS